MNSCKILWHNTNVSYIYTGHGFSNSTIVMAQSAGAAKYTDFPMNILDMTLDYLMVRLQ